MPNCILCKRDLHETSDPSLFFHDDVEDCLVRVADRFGVSADDDYALIGDDIYHRSIREELPQQVSVNEDVIELTQFFPMEKALPQVFSEVGLDRLGGASTGSGWSNISLWQRCPYAWKRRYLDPLKQENFGIEGEITALAIGSLVHTYLAIYYQRMIAPDYPLTPEHVNQRVRELGCDPEVFTEGWRLFTGYRLFYRDEVIQPLAVEFDLRDPRTNDSARYDLIAYFPEERPGMLPGTYVVESKTAARFTQDVLEGWVNDGEVLGQIDLWERMHLERRFGPLRGVVMNILGKQKVAEFHRTIVHPNAFQIEQHRDDLRHHKGQIQLAKSMGIFPRNRGNCIHRYGRCSLWNHCATGE